MATPALGHRMYGNIQDIHTMNLEALIWDYLATSEYLITSIAIFI